VLAFAFLIPNPDEDSAKASQGANASGGGSGTQGVQEIANGLAGLYFVSVSSPFTFASSGLVCLRCSQ
jgi:hypothetical protein